jgi:hypothetical protein
VHYGRHLYPALIIIFLWQFESAQSSPKPFTEYYSVLKYRKTNQGKKDEPSPQSMEGIRK